MDTINAVNESMWEAAHNVALHVLDGSLLHYDAPWSPDVSTHLIATMPDLTGRIPLTLPWSKVAPVDPEEHHVWLMDNTAFRAVRHLRPFNPRRKNTAAEPVPRPDTVSPDTWIAEFVAAYFISHSGRDISKVVADICHKLDISNNDDVKKKIIRQRAVNFANTILPRHTVQVSVATGEQVVLGPSSSSGISATLHEMPLDSPPTSANNKFTDVPPDSGFVPGTTVFAEPTGWGIISDIDDTIKITMTHSPIGILQTTFVEEPRPVPGMPELYSHISHALHNPPFFYLSASPYNLYPFLRSFRDDHYPHGTIILRDASWQNLGGLIESLRQNVQEYKVDRMNKIHAWLPGRKFICLGDSTQKDPESYGEIARRFPGFVKGIFIHKVSGVSGITDPDQATKNAPERFENAFRGLDRSMWYVFTKPEEVRSRIDEIVSKGL